MGCAQASAVVAGNDQMKGPHPALAGRSNTIKFLNGGTEWVF
jgi:hypothetical protein